MPDSQFSHLLEATTTYLIQWQSFKLFLGQKVLTHSCFGTQTFWSSFQSFHYLRPSLRLSIQMSTWELLRSFWAFLVRRWQWNEVSPLCEPAAKGSPALGIGWLCLQCQSAELWSPWGTRSVSSKANGMRSHHCTCTIWARQVLFSLHQCPWRFGRLCWEARGIGLTLCIQGMFFALRGGLCTHWSKWPCSRYQSCSLKAAAQQQWAWTSPRLWSTAVLPARTFSCWLAMGCTSRLWAISLRMACWQLRGAIRAAWLPASKCGQLALAAGPPAAFGLQFWLLKDWLVARGWPKVLQQLASVFPLLSTNLDILCWFIS